MALMFNFSSSVFYLIYHFGKLVYRALPMKKSTKLKIAAKIVPFLYKFYPRGRASSNFISDPMPYDVFRDADASHTLQDMLFPESLETAKRVMIILVPYYNVMSGGIYSMFSIATQAKRMKSQHGWEIVVMTLPNSGGVTYIRNRHFINNIDVFRFSQISRLKNAEELYIHLPELAASSFLSDLNRDEVLFIDSMRSVYVNILNQNIKLMPPAEDLVSIKRKFPNIGQSVAHHAYFGLDFAKKYRLNTMLLPAYTDLSDYIPLPLEKKEKLIIYSPDDAPYKSDCLSLLKSKLPDFSFVEIKDITFDKFMDYASRCLFSITFGEGMDGYFSQPILQGGIGLALYNEDFFPSPEFLECYNIFDRQDTLIREIVPRIKELLSDSQLYESLNARLKSMHDMYYSREEYILRIDNLCQRKYDIAYNELNDTAEWNSDTINTNDHGLYS